MQRLVRALHLIGSQASGHGLDALSFAIQQQPSAVIPQGLDAIRMPRSVRQPLQICREAFLLWCWRRRLRSHENIIACFCIL